MARRVLLRVALLVVGVAANPGRAEAHALLLEARQRGDRVTVEAFYDDDTPAVGARVRIVTAEGAAVLQGTTDDKGRWSFDAPAPGRYRVAVDAGAGHRKEDALTISARTEGPTTGPGASPAAEAPPATGPAVVVTEGPSREEATGPRRWLLTGVGLCVIAALTALARMATRKRLVPSQPGVQADQRNGCD